MTDFDHFDETPVKKKKNTSIYYILDHRTDSIFNKYDLGEQIGQPGQFGRARKCIRKSDGEQFAAKVIGKTRFRYKADCELVFQDLRDEIAILKALDHPNIVKLVEVFEDRKNLYLIMELCTGGELYDRIVESAEQHYGEEQAMKVVRQILEATQYFHKMRIIHNDLKPDNFLFDKDDNLKVIDFGMSKRLPRMKFLHDLVGTPYYTAPEVIDGNYGTSADIWSIGVVVYVMLFGYPPFYVDPGDNAHLEHEEIYRQIREGFTPKVKEGYGAWFPDFIPVSDAARDFVAKCLKLHPKDRITAHEALSHPWMNGKHAKGKLPGIVKDAFGSFHKTCAFSTAVCITFMDWLRKDEIEAARNAFVDMDENGDGLITLDEFKHAMQKSTDMDDHKMEEMFASCDINGDHVIKYKELVTALTHEHIRANDERLHEAFSELDVDDDGTISPKDLTQIMNDHKLSTKIETVKHFLSTADTNHDGKVDFQEFLQAISPELFDQHGDHENSVFHK